MSSIQTAHKKLLEEWSKSKKNIAGVESVLSQIKELLSDGATVSSLDDKAITTIQCDVYEISALLPIVKEDIETFKVAIAQVLSFYAMNPEASTNKYLMIGLNLMSLLAMGNRLSDFHMLLEQIPQNIQTSDPYILAPVRLEQAMMEGAYNKVVLTEKNFPSPYYEMFFRMMMDAVRINIATSIEKSFRSLNVSDATTRLLFDNEQQTKAFAESRSWVVEGGSFVFNFEAPVHEHELDTSCITKQLIFYAKQLEMIV
ncbi:unnamed protein product [Auanema sp. JU1783]|nr:unnamed protein product [Auanema sp. JU1783]